MIHFTLYARTYCHLCDDMLAALRAMDSTFPINVIDVDSDEKLVALYDELVPVLVASVGGQPPKQLCHYFLDEKAVCAFIADGNGK